MQQEWRHDDDDGDEAGFLILTMHSSDANSQLSSRSTGRWSWSQRSLYCLGLGGISTGSGRVSNDSTNIVITQ